MAADPDASPTAVTDRRAFPDRRRRLLHSIFVGGFRPRRRAHRRAEAATRHPLDFHDTRWLVVATAILLMSVADAFLTLRLIALGAVEVNPFMAWLLAGATPAFAFWKVGLTAGGVVLLTLLARLHVFGRLPVSVVLYFVLALYASLIGYEFSMLRTLLAAP